VATGEAGPLCPALRAKGSLLVLLPRQRGKVAPKATEGGGRVSVPAVAPSTSLWLVPLPRFAGEDACGLTSASRWSP